MKLMKCIFCHTTLCTTFCVQCVAHFIINEKDNIIHIVYIGVELTNRLYWLKIQPEFNIVEVWHNNYKLLSIPNLLWIFPSNATDLVNKLNNLVAFS